MKNKCVYIQSLTKEELDAITFMNKKMRDDIRFVDHNSKIRLFERLKAEEIITEDAEFEIIPDATH